MKQIFEVPAVRLTCSRGIQLRILQHPIDEGYVRSRPDRQISRVVAVVYALINQRSFYESQRITNQHAGEEFKSLAKNQILIKIPNTRKDISPEDHRRRRDKKASEKTAVNFFHVLTITGKGSGLEILPSLPKVALRSEERRVGK